MSAAEGRIKCADCGTRFLTANEKANLCPECEVRAVSATPIADYSKCPFCDVPITYGDSRCGRIRQQARLLEGNVVERVMAHAQCITDNPGWQPPWEGQRP